MGAAGQFSKKVRQSKIDDNGKKIKVYSQVPDSGILIAGNKYFSLDEFKKYSPVRSGARLNISVFDYSQNTKFKADKQGVFEISKVPGSLVCYASKPKTGMKTQSHLLDSFIKHIATKGQTAGELMSKIKADTAKQKQEIHYHFGLKKDEDAEIVPLKTIKITKSAEPPANPKAGDQWMSPMGLTFAGVHLDHLKWA